MRASSNNSNNNNKQDETKKGGESEQTKAGQSDSTVEQSEEEKGTAVRILAVSDKYYIEGVEKSLDDIAKVIDDADENTRFVRRISLPTSLWQTSRACSSRRMYHLQRAIDTIV